MMETVRKKKPVWLKRKLPQSPVYENVRGLVKKNKLHTVCEEAKCPNQFECYSNGTSTFMIMGDKCTRNCGFCSVSGNPLEPPDYEEPFRIGKTVHLMNLDYVVITSVTRDDLTDGGASFFAETVKEIKRRKSDTLVEILIPDFKGCEKSLKTVLDAKPDVLNHNIETVRSLYSKVRPEADYNRSLNLIYKSSRLEPLIPVKTGLMTGLGEEMAELAETFKDIKKCGCNMLTIGQYLQPSKKHLNVEKYITPEEFDVLKEKALSSGIKSVASGPFVRSSYKAAEMYFEIKSEKF